MYLVLRLFGMNSFNSLTLALEGWFDKQLCDLPDALRRRVEDELEPPPWDRLTAHGRRDVAQQLDAKDDPALEQARQFWWDLADRKISIEAQIAEWKSIPTLSAGELALKESKLEELQRQIFEIDNEEFVPSVELNSLDQLALKPISNIQQKHDVGSREWYSQNARIAANIRHDQPGGSRDKQRQIQEIWASGKYLAKDVCAEQECAALNMSFSAARRALRNLPKPSRC